GYATVVPSCIRSRASAGGAQPRDGRRRAPPLSRSGCVLPRQLRRGALQLLLLPIQPCLSAPGALEVVADVEVQPAQALGLDLDPIAVLEAAQPAVIRAGRDQVAGLERVDRGDPLDAARNLVGHVA